MKIDFIDINLASSISGKSLQTIRRAIKAKKISARKKKTPQGFCYFISKQSVMNFFDIKKSSLREIPLENQAESISADSKNPASHPASHVTGHAAGHAAGHAPGQISSRPEESASDHFGATISELKELKKMVQSFMTQYQKEREQVGSVLSDLQGRLMVSENQVRLLSAPKKKWFQFWKS